MNLVSKLPKKVNKLLFYQQSDIKRINIFFLNAHNFFKQFKMKKHMTINNTKKCFIITHLFFNLYRNLAVNNTKNTYCLWVGRKGKYRVYERITV